MNKLLLCLATFCLIGVVTLAQDATPEVALTTAEISFEKESHDFGKIPQGIPATYEFMFTNAGKEPLIVNNVQKTCGCTVTQWTKTPVMPGQTGTVTAQYNAAREGKFRKPIHVHSNAKNDKITLYFEGEVLKKSDDSTPLNENAITNPEN